MAVHADDYTVDVTTEYLGQVLEKIPYASQYAHHANGEGLYYIPEVGAWCWVCFPADNNRPFVLACMPPFSLVDDYKGNRMELAPGDQAMISRDLNGIIVRRGGIVEIGATPVCQRVYTPIANKIRDHCENYELNAAGGQLSWSVKRSAPNEKALSPTLLTIEAREFAQADPVVVVQIGSVETPVAAPPTGPSIPVGKKVYIDIAVNGMAGLPTFRYRVNLDGDSLMVQSGNRSINVLGNEIHYVNGNQELQIFGDEKETVVGESKRKYGSEDVTVLGNSKERVVGNKTIIAPQIFLGMEAGAVPTLLGPALLAWLNTHIHGTAAGPTTPPVTPAMPTLLTTKVKVS
jgi:hypothetical protein